MLHLLQILILSFPYSKLGVYDVQVYETSLSYWKKEKRLIVTESIPCGYWGHEEQRDPLYKNHSYFRIRDFETGKVISNIKTSIGFGFGNAFVDYEFDKFWIFGTPNDRCRNQNRPFGPPVNETNIGVYSWWSSNLVNWTRCKTTVTWNGPNVDVAKVYSSPYQRNSSIPFHKYVMATEDGIWFVSNTTAGDLSKGWIALNSSKYKGGSYGCPSVRYLPHDGYYYVVSGGKKIYLQRSRNLQDWELAVSPVVEPSRNDSHVTNLVNGVQNILMQPNASYSLSHLSDWDNNTNDADLCCESWGGASDIKNSYLVYGVSDQGSKTWKYPGAFSGLSEGNMTLDKLLQSFF